VPPANLLDFTGKTILVIGGSSGIGNGIAQKFRDQGGDVFVSGTRANVADYGGEPNSDLRDMHFSHLDVSNLASIEAWMPAFTSLDVLIMAQGAVVYRRKEFELPTFDEVVKVNLHSLLACSMRFFEMLKRSRGSIIIVSSTAAFHANIGNPAYNASKAGAVGLTRTLGAAWASEGIRVNGIAPGFVATKMTRVTTESPKRLAAIEERIPLRRIGVPSDMGGVALFLASPLASYVIGQTIPVDGGLMHV
jgi:3-oxoacyl-[acyl-carrier protein] reductase